MPYELTHDLRRDIFNMLPPLTSDRRHKVCNKIVQKGHAGNEIPRTCIEHARDGRQIRKVDNTKLYKRSKACHPYCFAPWSVSLRLKRLHNRRLGSKAP